MQLTVLLMQQREPGLSLAVGSTVPDLLAALHLNADEADAMVDAVRGTDVPVQTWEAPSKHALLPDFLRLAWKIAGETTRPGSTVCSTTSTVCRRPSSSNVPMIKSDCRQ